MKATSKPTAAQSIKRIPPDVFAIASREIELLLSRSPSVLDVRRSEAVPTDLLRARKAAIKCAGITWLSQWLVRNEDAVINAQMQLPPARRLPVGARSSDVVRNSLIERYLRALVSSIHDARESIRSVEEDVAGLLRYRPTVSDTHASSVHLAVLLFAESIWTALWARTEAFFPAERFRFGILGDSIGMPVLVGAVTDLWPELRRKLFRPVIDIEKLAADLEIETIKATEVRRLRLAAATSDHQTCASDEDGVLSLGGMRYQVGTEVVRVTEREDEVLTAFAERGPWLIKPELIKASGRPEAVWILKQIKKNYPCLTSSVCRPSLKGKGGYFVNVKSISPKSH